jgi:hypothetical protein
MTQYKETKRNLMKEFKINSIRLSPEDIILASSEARIKFTTGCVLAISAVKLYRIYLFSDEVGNCYYTAFGDCLPVVSAIENGTPISFQYKEDEVWWGRTYKIKHLKYQNAVEKKISEILYGVNHLGY